VDNLTNSGLFENVFPLVITRFEISKYILMYFSLLFRAVRHVSKIKYYLYTISTSGHHNYNKYNSIVNIESDAFF